MSELSEPLVGTEIEKLLAQREQQLAEAVALGKTLLEERESLEHQVNHQMEEEARRSTNHRRELDALSAQFGDMTRSAQLQNDRIAELQEELRTAQEELQGQRQEVAALRVANKALESDNERVHENEQRRSQRFLAVQESEEEHEKVERELSDWQEKYSASRSEVNQLQAKLRIAEIEVQERRTSQRVLDAKVLELEKRLGSSEQALDRQRRMSFASPQPKAARDSFVRTPNQSRGNQELNREFEDFSLRSRTRSVVHLALQPPEPEETNESKRLQSESTESYRNVGRRRRGSDDSVAPSATVIAPSPLPKAQDDATTGHRAKEEEMTDRCPHCGRGAAEPAPQTTKRKSCCLIC